MESRRSKGKEFDNVLVAVVLVVVGVVGVIGVVYYFYYYYSVGGPYSPGGGGEYIVARVPRIQVVDVYARGYLRGLDYRANVTAVLENLGDRGCYAYVYLYCTCDGTSKGVYDYVYVAPRSYAYAYGDVDVAFWSNCDCGARVEDIECP